MDINQVLNEYDAMFGNNTLDEIENFLFQKITEAVKEHDNASIFTLLNEMIGFCRDTMQKDKGLAYCHSLLGLMEGMKLQGTVAYATSLLNIANAYRAFGKHNESLAFFEKTYEIYQKNFEQGHFSYASLFNNWSLLYQEMARFQDAKEKLLLALDVVDRYPEAKIQQAVTRTNLASTMLEIGDEKNRTEAFRYVQEARNIFEEDGGRDFHYGAALVVMGDVHYKNHNFAKAVEFYQRGLLEVEKHVGRNDNYVRVYEKYQSAIEQCSIYDSIAKIDRQVGWITNIERSRLFYESFGKDMIHEQFPDYESRIAVGIVGEGSDCFGFDDYISSDHDYAVGFCMWLTESDYEKIGKNLQIAYEKLLNEHGLLKQHGNLLGSRRGVCTINHFYRNILGSNQNFEENNKIALEYECIEEYRFAEVTNGCIFLDALGLFTQVRKFLQYYPEKIWRKRLAIELHDFSQYAQSNYPRMMARKDYVTANLCVSKAVESVMNIMYLLNKVYAPYYKWKKRGLEQLSLLKSLIPLLEEVILLPNQKEVWNGYVYTATKLNEKDEIVVTFENIANLILEELMRQGLVEGTDSFLEKYVEEILNGCN